MNWKRARSEEQKEQRIAEILAATARLYKKRPFEEITFSAIAKEAKFTRSNLYKYFSSKEEIFLEFLKHDLLLWKKDLMKAFRKNKDYSVEEFAAIWVELFFKHGRMMDLFSILSTFLEKNITLDYMVAFKRTLKDEVLPVAQYICQLFPSLTLEKALSFLNILVAAANGLYQMTTLTPLQREVMEYPEFKEMRIDFRSSYQEMVEHLLRGMLEPSAGS
jgi:AcrR family transcriptional regulator